MVVALRYMFVLSALFAFGLISGPKAASAADAGFIAGTAPSHRPSGAPVIKKFDHSKKWYAAALNGVSEPYPPSLVFLDNQGGWFSPFVRAGMVGKYDLRGWHRK